MKWNWKCLVTSTSLGHCQQKSASLLTWLFLSVRTVPTEWPGGSWEPDDLKAVGLSFCSGGTHRAALALASLSADSVISLDASAHRRSSPQLAAHRPLEHMGQRGDRTNLYCSWENSCFKSFCRKRRDDLGAGQALVLVRSGVTYTAHSHCLSCAVCLLNSHLNFPSMCLWLTVLQSWKISVSEKTAPPATTGEIDGIWTALRLGRGILEVDFLGSYLSRLQVQWP